MITSAANGQVRAAQALLKKRSQREQQKAFVIEGIRSLREAPAEDVKKLFMTEVFYAHCTGEDRGFIDALPCEKLTVSEEVMRRLSDTMHPQGVLAIVGMCEDSAETVLSGETPLVMILENLQDPGNLGTIVRTAEGAGVTGIILAGDTADLYNPKVVRATMGSVFRMPVIRCGAVADLTKTLHERAIRLYAADLSGSDSYDACDYRGGTAFLIGNEGNGLTKQALDAADVRIRIPMKGAVESLNAGIAAALLSFEAARQRRFV